MKFLGIIPARGGSKGIPRKNVKIINGKPLIYWTIEVAKKSKLLNSFIVSTEDAQIAEVSKSYEAKVINRPLELARDETAMLSVLQHALSLSDADAVVLLQPTSPVRDEGLIDDCIKRFQHANADNLATGFICKFVEYGKTTKIRQDEQGFFYNDGNILIIKSALIRNGEMVGKKIERVCISREQNFEIDDEFDFWLCEQILKKRSQKL